MKTWLVGGRGAGLVLVLVLMFAFPPKVSSAVLMFGGFAMGIALYAAGYSHGRHGE